MGTLYWTILSQILGVAMFREIMALNRNTEKDSLNLLTGPYLEYFTYGSILLCIAPKMVLSPGLLLDSGVQAQSYPLTHILLDRFHAEITVIVFSFLFIQFVVSLQRGAYRY